MKTLLRELFPVSGAATAVYLLAAVGGMYVVCAVMGAVLRACGVG